MTGSFKLGAAVHRALLECDTVEEVAEVFNAVKDSKSFMTEVTTRTPSDHDGLRKWLGIKPITIFESPPCGLTAKPTPSHHFEALARHGATDMRSMMLRLLRLARQERSRIEKNAFLPRRVKDDVRRRHGEMLKEARAFRSFPDYPRLP